MIPDLKDQEHLIRLSEKGIYLEGNILKVITSDNEPFTKYLQEAISKDRETRRKRLEITKQVQEQNYELLKSQESNEQLLRELKEALQDAERAKLTAETDLDLLQKRIQYELMGMIVRTALGIILGLTSRLYTQGLAILFAILGLALSFWISRQVKFGGQILRLVLSGIAVSAFFSAGVGILKYLADPVQQLPEIVFWLLGGLWAVKWDDLIFILPIISSVIVVTILLRWRLNVLTLSQEVAFSLGVDKNRETLGMILISVIITALVVSYSGIVSWIGLVIPNISRILIGADTEKTVPVTIMLGGIFALICDDLARTLLAGEIPLSIFTALLGASIFIVIFSIKRESLP